MLNISVYIIAGILVFSLMFIPIKIFSIYSNLLLKLGILFFVASLIMDVYFFVKDTPKRKYGKKKDGKKILGVNRKVFLNVLNLIGLTLLLILIIAMKSGKIGSLDCPDEIEGNIESEFRIKYFYSPFCPYCWKQEPILKEAVKIYGDRFSLERYDIRYCKEETAKYNIVGTPSFVFIPDNDSTEYVSYGFIPRGKFLSIIEAGRDKGINDI